MLSCRAAVVPFVAFAWLLSSCGGGSGGATTVAPANLSYANPVLVVMGQPLAPLVPSVNGAPTTFGIQPALPSGLVIAGDTGRITGTPTVVTAAATYTITAANAAGSTSFEWTLTVVAAPVGGGFGPAEVLSGAGAADPQVVVDGDGDAIVAWLQQEPGSASRSLWHRRRDRTLGWLPGERLELAVGDADEFHLAGHAASGRAVVAWLQLVAGRRDAFARIYDPASGWGPTVGLETSPGVADELRAAIDGDGRCVAVWGQDDQQIGRFSIWASVLAPGSGWGAATLLETTDTIGGQDGTPRVVMLPGGEALVVWEQSGSPRINLWTNRYQPGSGWGTAAQLVPNEGVLQSLRSPELAADATGRALLVWGQVDVVGGSAQSTVRHRRYAGGWQTGRDAVGPVIVGSLIPRPRVVLDGNGAALVVWGGADNRAQASTSPWNGTWTAVSPGAALAGVATSVPSAGLDGVGGGFVAWAQQTAPGTNDVYAARRLGAVWAAPVVLDDFAGTAATPSLGCSDAGAAVVAWTQFVANVGTVIVARHFAP